MDLEKILKACKRNNLKAQSQLYQNYKDDLYVLCLKYCSNAEEAEDNLQDSFLDIFKKIKTYKGIGSFEGWMKRITINKAIDKYKKVKPISISINNDLLEDTSVNAKAVDSIPLDEILQHVQNLPARYRLVFNLYEMDGYSHKEISKLLEISINTSKSNLHRAKSILKQKLQPSRSSINSFESL